MSIKIPETIKTYCANEDNTDAMDLICKDKCNKYSLSEIDEHYQAYLFAEKFKYDMWKFRLDLWSAVWEKLLKEYEDTDYLKMKDYDYSFYVEYKIKKTNYRFQIVDFNGQRDDLFVSASYSSGKKGNQKAAIADVSDINNLVNEDYRDGGTYTRGKTSIDMKNKTEITDEEIEKLRKDARTILEALNISFSE